MLFPDPKPGDIVGIYYRAGFGGRALARQTIERVTATQVVSDGVRYKRENGRRVGGEPYVSGVFPWTPEHDVELARAVAVDRFNEAVDNLKSWHRGAQTINVEAATVLAAAIETFLAPKT